MTPFDPSAHHSAARDVQADRRAGQMVGAAADRKWLVLLHRLTSQRDEEGSWYGMLEGSNVRRCRFRRAPPLPAYRARMGPPVRRAHRPLVGGQHVIGAHVSGGLRLVQHLESQPQGSAFAQGGRREVAAHGGAVQLRPAGAGADLQAMHGLSEERCVPRQRGLLREVRSPVPSCLCRLRQALRPHQGPSECQEVPDV